MKMKLIYKKNLIWIALLHWLITIFTDRFIFQYVYFDTSNTTQIIKTAMTYGAKAVFAFVLILIYQGAYYFFCKVDKKYVVLVCSYFALNIVLLLLVWPGVWRLDEFGILNSATQLLPVFWQNYITSLFYILSLMIFPFPSGIIIVQCIVISLIVGKIVKLSTEYFGKAGYFMFVPFVLLPVLDSNMYPLRMSVYGMLELLLVVSIFTKWQSRKEKSLFENYIAFVILASFVTVVRTEAVYYFLFFPLLLFILFHNEETKRNLWKVISTYLCISLLLYIPQSLGNRLTSGERYDLTSVLNPIFPLIAEANEDEEGQEFLTVVDTVLDLDVVEQCLSEGRSGISSYWNRPELVRNYTNEQYKEFKSTYYQMIVQYPGVFLLNRFESFLNSTDLIGNTTELYEVENPNYTTFQQYPLTALISNEVRSTVIKALEWRTMDSYEVKRSGYAFIYGSVFPIAVLFLVWAFCMLHKKWAMFFLLSLPFIKVPLVFITSPSDLFMYYYSAYLIGYVVFVFLLVKAYKKVYPMFLKTSAYYRRNGYKETLRAMKQRTNYGGMDSLSLKAAKYEGCKAFRKILSRADLEEEMSKQKQFAEAQNLKISIVVPTYETKPKFYIDLLESVCGQTYSNFELVIADASTSDGVEKITKQYQDKLKAANSKGTIQYFPLDLNAGISQNTNEGIKRATGDYIALLDHDDLLTQDALYEVVQAILAQVEPPVALYSDEDKCNSDATEFFEPHFKPDFNLDLLLSNNYICHFLVVRQDVLKELQLRSVFNGAQDYDLVLRLANLEGEIVHIPHILYHWRCHEQSTAGNTQSKQYAYEAGRKALYAYFEEIGLGADVKIKNSLHLGFYETVYKDGIFATREDVGAICGLVVEKGRVVGGPKIDDTNLFDGMAADMGGYLHRATLRMDATDCDRRALIMRPGFEGTLEDALQMGYKLVYDPTAF